MMMNSCELEQSERHAYISGDTKRAALLAEIIDLRHEVDNLQYRLDEEDDDSTD
jgi:hypothetical protein